MEVALDVVLVAAGVLLIIVTLTSVIRTTILPRGVSSWIAREVFFALRVLFRLRTGRSPTYEKRDRVMAMIGPVYLLSLLATWLGLLVIAYTAIYYGLRVHPFQKAIELSGSAIFTLGTATTSKFGANVGTYTEAGLGLLLLTLLITYLPTIYTAFSRREAAVTQLEVRAGTPPSATALLVRYHRIDKLDQLDDLWQQWESWFADVEETHISFPVLAFFRSPEPDHSWVTAGGTVLDAASLWVSTVEHPNDPDAQLFIRSGYIALDRIASFFGVAYVASPRPDDPISISRTEYDDACRSLAEAGLPLREDLDAAWQAFSGWRVNYDTVLLNLARLTEAPIAPWTSDRSPLSEQLTWSLKSLAPVTRPRGRRPARRGSRGQVDVPSPPQVLPPPTPPRPPSPPDQD
jgi:hypothetical protein